MFSLFADYYYIVIILEVVCAIHCIRKGNQNKWLWLIIFIPVVGCIAYIFTEIFTRNEMEQVQSGVSSIFNPSGKIRSLQDNLKFRDTFDNRMALADAYLDAGQTDLALDLYETSLTGTFAEHEHGNMQLIKAYFQKGRYEELIAIAKKLYNLPQFKRSRAHIMYAAALGFTGKTVEAEAEFTTMAGKFSNYESRYYYGKFLLQNNRTEEAIKMYRNILSETSHLSSPEKRHNRIWFDKIKSELKNLQSV